MWMLQPSVLELSKLFHAFAGLLLTWAGLEPSRKRIFHMCRHKHQRARCLKWYYTYVLLLTWIKMYMSHSDLSWFFTFIFGMCTRFCGIVWRVYFPAFLHRDTRLSAGRSGGWGACGYLRVFSVCTKLTSHAFGAIVWLLDLIALDADTTLPYYCSTFYFQLSPPSTTIFSSILIPSLTCSLCRAHMRTLDRKNALLFLLNVHLHHQISLFPPIFTLS